MLTRRQFLLMSAALPLAASAAPYTRANRDVEIWRDRWRDGKRERDVPVKFYYPLRAEAPCPVIVFSHGLGGSREGYEFLGRHWASQGYCSLHIQHIGSDESLLLNRTDVRATLVEAANARNVLQRARDVSFALDQLNQEAIAASPLAGKLDLERIAMAGHSFGANTTLMVCGMKLIGPRGQAISAADRRIKAGLVLSPPAPKTGDYASTFGSLRLPLLHMTGTKDESPLPGLGTTALQRRLPFEHIRGADAYLLTFQDGEHMLFSGPRFGRTEPGEAHRHDLILQSSGAFLDAYLRGDIGARSWLTNDFAQELGNNGTFEQKLVKIKT